RRARVGAGAGGRRTRLLRLVAAGQLRMGRGLQQAVRSGARGLRLFGAHPEGVLRVVPRPHRGRARMTTTSVALAEPTVPVRPRWIALLAVANLAVWMGFFTPIQVLLPEQ